MTSPIKQSKQSAAIVIAIMVIFVFGVTPSAFSQVRLPTVQTPQLPGVQLPVDPNGLLNGTTAALDARRLQDLRRIRIRDLLRTRRQFLETDPRGAPIVRAEIVAYSPSASSLQIARDLGMTVVREDLLGGLDVSIVVLSPRQGTSTRAALRRLQRADPTGSYDYNHVYIESGVQVEQANGQRRVTTTMIANARVGLIDTGVDNTHPSLAKAVLHRWGCDDRSEPAFHGTAVASLLVGDADQFAGAASGASLYSADVYCGKPTGGAVDNIAKAFAWLAVEKVAVINVSLVGPPNALLEKVVLAMIAKGHIIVAAVGNDGPAAPPLYPASYPGVIGVTGVDDHHRVLLEAAQGKQVFLAAPGADMAAANFNGGYVGVRGTSFAAPVVAGLLAQHYASPDPSQVKQIIAALVSEAIDLGPRGVDKIYGQGLVGDSLRVAPKDVIVSAK